MDLENKNFTITGSSVSLGDYLNELEITNVYDHMQATIYYQSGLIDIDIHFGDKGYIKSGYVCTMASYTNVVSIIFFKYVREVAKDMGIVIIERSKVIRYEQEPATNLTVVKKEATAHKTKYVLKRGIGVIGALGGVVADQFINVNTETVNGMKFKLFYKDANDIEQFIVLYSPDEHVHKTILFLNTYYKNELPSAAKTPVDNSSTCFIATACYRDIFSDEVIFFRWYRDNKLSNSYWGRLFIKVYYKISPSLYRFLFDNRFYSNIIKSVLDKIYISLSKNIRK